VPELVDSSYFCKEAVATDVKTPTFSFDSARNPTNNIVSLKDDARSPLLIELNSRS
jgi:hypothetical protein